DMKPTIVSSNGTESGQIIVTSFGSQNGHPNKAMTARSPNIRLRTTLGRNAA
ncbi:Shaggy-related protein kinase alpha, partial [Striga hermonthica]